MKIELKNFKHAAFASEGTLCFTASVYVDGVRMFEASNSGKGEENRIVPVKGKTRKDVRRVQNWIATQPKVKLEDDMEIDDDLDFYISRLADREVSKRHLKSLLKKHLVIFDPSVRPIGLRQFASAFNPADIRDAHRVQLNRIYPGCLILNDLNIEQALDLYVASSNSEVSEILSTYERIKSKLVA